MTHGAQIMGITVNGIYCMKTIVYHILSCVLILAKVSHVSGIIEGCTQIVPYKKCKYFQFSLYRKNCSFISCWRSHRYKQRPHGWGHQFCGKMYCNSCEYLILNECGSIIPLFALLLVTFAFAESGGFDSCFNVWWLWHALCCHIFRICPSTKKFLLFIVLGTQNWDWSRHTLSIPGRSIAKRILGEF